MTDEDLVPAVEFMRSEYGEHEKLLDVEERTELSLLMTKFATLRVREELEAAAKEFCLYCAGKAEGVTPKPYDMGETQYVPNCGMMSGYVHARDWGGVNECDAEPLWKRLSELAGSEESK